MLIYCNSLNYIINNDCKPECTVQEDKISAILETKANPMYNSLGSHKKHSGNCSQINMCRISLQGIAML